MNKEPRKASEVLLELEKKIDIILGIIRTQDLNIKILSNKLNTLLDTFNNKNIVNNQKITIEAADVSKLPPNLGDQKHIPISPESSILLDESPKGFRRTSRPETFSGDDSYLPQNIKYPVQVPKYNDVENIIVHKEISKKIEPSKEKSITTNRMENSIPTSQRVVNSNGKSLFLADVEILSLPDMQVCAKTRTNGTGKWSAPLSVGNYRVIIRKFEPSSGGKLEAIQDIQVDGVQSPYELQAIIIK